MKQYYGNYLGMCISSDDPEQRGRVQIFIPHIMPTLYEGWNEDGKDHSFVGLGDNIQNGLPSEVIDKLRKILPWAEAASPIIGASSPGTLTRSAAAISSAASAVATETTSLLGKLGKWLLNQSPTSTPSTPQSKNGTSQPIETTSTSGTENVANPNVLSGPAPIGTDPTKNNYGVPNTNLSTNTSLTNALNSSNTNKVVGNNIKIDANGTTSRQLELGGKGGANPETSYFNGQIDATKVIYASIPGSPKGPMAVQLGNNPPVVLYNLDNGAISGTIELSPAAMVAVGGNFKVVGGDIKTLLGDGATLSYAPITDGSYPPLSQIKDINQYQSLTNNQLTDAQRMQLSDIVKGTSNIAGSTSPTNLVNKTDPHGPTASYNLNDTAKGMFSYPLPGAMLWVFFQDGNPLFPVYFAANYGAAEWKSAYKYNSPGHAYTPDANGNNPATSVGGVMNLGAGVMSWATTNHPENFTKSEQSFYIGHDDGSNMYFVKGYHQLYSKFDRRDQVDGNRYNSTLGYKEEWVQGDSNQVIMGDSIIKVGNCSQAAVDAALKIQQLGCEIYKPITDKKVSK